MPRIAFVIGLEDVFFLSEDYNSAAIDSAPEYFLNDGGELGVVEVEIAATEREKQDTEQRCVNPYRHGFKLINYKC